MPELRQTAQGILATGKVDGHDLEVLRRKLYDDGKVHRQEADLLVELHKRVEHLTPAFEHFYYQAIKDHILADGRIGAEAAAWLRRLLLGAGTMKDEGRRLLHELKGEAREVGPEFDLLFADGMRLAQEQHTCG